jgi:asparagine synthase (glutamine-hydrolysing)
MCGIAGFFNSTQLDRSLESLIGMLAAISHRGPDATGVYIDDHIALGHVRLSIIDLAGGNQPIHNEDKTVWVTYNGEIFNYPELRVYLEKKGHSFTTNTDTEILVHLYEEEGVEFLNRLNGQWAFALWDSSKQRLFLSRDRVGIRPLYYTTNNGTFIFASEIKALFSLPELQKRIDPEALDQIFTFWTTLPGKTVFENVSELHPGRYLLSDRNGITIRKYWDIPLYNADCWSDETPEQLSDQLRVLLEDAVKIRLRADVPVGTYLSGGLDSSGITAIVAKKYDPDVNTFGIRFEENQFDEGDHQHEMVRFLGVKHRELFVSNRKIGEYFLPAVRHCEKPLLRTAPVPLYLLAEQVKNSAIKVVLTGEGADEFGGGYDIFKEALIRRFWARQPDSQWRGKLIERLYPDIFRDQRTRKMLGAFFKKGIAQVDDPLYTHLIRWNNTSRIKAFFSADLIASIGTYDRFEDCRSRLPADFASWHTLHKAQYLEISIFLSNYLLSSQGDRMGMAHSIEVRMPYLDYRILDFMGQVPPWWKLCGLHEKHLLKKALQPYLPPSITARVKHPYRAPIHGSLLSLLRSASGEDLLSEKTIGEAGLFDVKKVAALLDKLRLAASASETDTMALAGIISTQYIQGEFTHGRIGGATLPGKLDLLIDKRTAQ